MRGAVTFALNALINFCVFLAFDVVAYLVSVYGFPQWDTVGYEYASASYGFAKNPISSTWTSRIGDGVAYFIRDVGIVGEVFYFDPDEDIVSKTPCFWEVINYYSTGYGLFTDAGAMTDIGFKS